MTTTTASRSTAPSTIDPAPTPQMRMLVDRHHRAITWQGNVPTLMAAVPADTREAMKDRLTALRKALAPINSMAERDQVALALTRMFSRYVNTGSVSNQRATITAYVTALSGFPAWAVLKAIEEVERGAVEGMNPDFPPSAPRLCQIAEGHTAQPREEKAKVEAVLNARVDEVTQRDPDEVARVAAKMRAAADELGARVAAEQGETEQRRRERDAQKIAANDREIIREYHAAGIAPVMASNGRPMSMTLARMSNLKLHQLGEAPPPACEFYPNDQK